MWEGFNLALKDLRQSLSFSIAQVHPHNLAFAKVYLEPGGVHEDI
jgi:penicillin-binding protein-related factor A (putative recombinase)